MNFEKLRLSGFKSFVETTDFHIENGLTGVVGPNGCGKSNLVEALRWVMGESSFKNMRASGMDDVIFSGSANRPARNLAEVSLFLDNKDRSAPAAFNDSDELHVTRRIEREAGSNYKINGKDARAKDVQLLFADASTGARSPSMVGQGRIGELIAAKPTSRRLLLEEAAGISGLHSRRHEAELRLRAAEGNLERLEDVLGQLEQQLEALKRQSRQAARYGALSDEIRSCEAIVFYLRWTQAKTAQGEAESQLSIAMEQVAEKAQKSSEASKEQAIIASQIPDLRQREVEAAAGLQRLSIARDQIDSELAELGKTKQQLLSRIKQLLDDLAREVRLVDENSANLVSLETEKKSIAEQLDGTDERKAALEQAFLKAEEISQDSEQKLNEATALFAEKRAALQQAVKRLEELQLTKTRLIKERSLASENLTQLQTQLETLPDPKQLEQAKEQLEQDIRSCEEAIAKADKSQNEQREKLNISRQKVQEAQSALQAHQTESVTLSNILKAGSDELSPAIVDQISVEKGYERALGAALGEDLDISTHKGAKAYWSGCEIGDDDPKLPDGLQPLNERVNAPDQLSRRLAQIGIAAPSEADALAKQLCVGQRIVSLQGDLWRWDGFFASADAPTAAAQKLAHKNRLAELDTLISKASELVEDALVEQRLHEAELRENNEHLQALREALKVKQAAFTKASSEFLQAERDRAQLAARHSALQSTVQRLDTESTQLDARVETAQGEAKSAEDLSQDQEKLDALQSQVQRDRAASSQARLNRDGLARELELMNNRLTQIGNEEINWKRRIENSISQKESLETRLKQANEQLANLDERPGAIEEKRRSLNAQITDAQTVRQQAADALAKRETAQREADWALKKVSDELYQLRENRVRAEERLAALKSKLSDTENQIVQEMEMPASQLPQKMGLASGVAGGIEGRIAEGAALPEKEATERKLEKLRADRDRLGAVNLRAEVEQKEIAQRHASLCDEQNELLEAIAKLRGVIGSLNRQGRERLLAAFDQVNEQFERLFEHLFGGGTAELQLVESDDPLEAGLEILARPPGKKPQTMTLLSGGEQALTAMALIFAVFLTNPAPICVLDEVDAPLDDHNVERYCNLLDEMVNSTKTRFVIITHNPITMARMDRLFGVTMGERGVSQIVSVDLARAEEMIEQS